MFYDDGDALERRIEHEINRGGEFNFLDEVSIFLDSFRASEDVFNFFLDSYLEKKRKGVDDYSAKFSALRESYDYLYYGEEIRNEIKKREFMKELERVKRGFKSIELLIKDYVKINYFGGEAKEMEAFLNKKYFDIF